MLTFHHTANLDLNITKADGTLQPACRMNEDCERVSYDPAMIAHATRMLHSDQRKSNVVSPE